MAAQPSGLQPLHQLPADTRDDWPASPGKTGRFHCCRRRSARRRASHTAPPERFSPGTGRLHCRRNPGYAGPADHHVEVAEHRHIFSYRITSLFNEQADIPFQYIRSAYKSLEFHPQGDNFEGRKVNIRRLSVQAQRLGILFLHVGQAACRIGRPKATVSRIASPVGLNRRRMRASPPRCA